MIDAARLADELRSEQELAQSLEREKRLLEAQVKDMQARVDEAQTNALKGGKKAMTRMDTRIRELESELDAENRRNADSLKNLRKSERKIKELTYSQEEVSSLILRSDLRRFFRLSALRLFSASSSDSSSRMRVSILVMAFLPPLRAEVWASSTLACMSFT